MELFDLDFSLVLECMVGFGVEVYHSTLGVYVYC